MVALAEYEQTFSAAINTIEMIGELDLTQELTQQLGASIASLVARHERSEALHLLQTRYPTALAVYLVAKGIYGYHGGDYWPGVAAETGLTKNILSTQLGGFFERFLQERGLRRFRGIQGHRFLTLILTHGGIPDYSLGDFFKHMLMPATTSAEWVGMDAQDLINYWLNQSSGRYSTDMPVQRFLKYGGKLAVDFVARCLEMAATGWAHGSLDSTHGLGVPERVVQRFQHWLQTASFDAVTGSRIRLQRPVIGFDPFSQTLSIELPEQQFPASFETYAGEWRITQSTTTLRLPFNLSRSAQGWSSDFQYSVLESVEDWTVEYNLGAIQRTWRLPGMTRAMPVLAFDPATGLLLRHAGTLPAETIWLLTEQRLPLIVEGGQLRERFAAVCIGSTVYRVEAWDLQAADAVQIGHIQIAVEPDENLWRPRLEGQLVAGLNQSASYAPVYHGRMPAICIPVPPQRSSTHEAARWHVRIREEHSGALVECSLQDIPLQIETNALRIDLADPALLGADAWGTFDVALRGPLGRDASFRFGFVSKLDLPAQQEIRQPDASGLYEEPFRILRTAPGLVIESADPKILIEMNPYGSHTLTALATDVTIAPFAIRKANQRNGNVVYGALPLPLLRWALVEQSATLRSAPEWQARPLSLSLAWLEQHPNTYLLLDVAPAEALDYPLRGELRVISPDNYVVQVLRSRGQHKRWLQFSLHEALDTLRASSMGRVRFEFASAPAGYEHDPLIILSVAQALDLTALTIDWTHDAHDWLITTQWTGGRQLQQRIIRWWPLWRPWEGPVTIAVPDSAIAEWSYVISHTILPPGAYRIEMTTADQWSSTQPVRPANSAPDTLNYRLGSDALIELYLSMLPASAETQLQHYLARPVATTLKTPEPRTSAETTRAALQLFHTLLMRLEVDQAQSLANHSGDVGIALLQDYLNRMGLETFLVALSLGMASTSEQRGFIEVVLWSIDPTLGELFHQVVETRRISTQDLDERLTATEEERASLHATLHDYGVTTINYETSETNAPIIVPARSFYDEIPPWLMSENMLDSVRIYLHEIGQYPLLTADQEQRLGQRVQDGLAAEIDVLDDANRYTPLQLAMLDERVRLGREARDQMVQANLRLVISVARRYIRSSLGFLDLVQEGNIGLMRAVDKFDPQRGHKFSTYATWWIRQAITRANADQSRAIRLPVHLHEQLNRMHRANAQLIYDLGREPTDTELAAVMEIPLGKLYHLRRAGQETLSLAMPVGEDDGSTLGDLIAAHDEFSIDDQILEQDLRDVVQQLLNTVPLTDRERHVLDLRFGITNNQPQTLESVGQHMGVTRERIRQIERKALTKLQKSRATRISLAGYNDQSYS